VRILLVEDDPKLSDVVAEGLREEKLEVITAASYGEGRLKAGLSSFDVIVLDVLLPGGSGFDLCTHLRGRGVRTPILMLTSRGAVEDRVRGLECGADDYLTKPFDFRELLARIRALGRRLPEVSADAVEVADLAANLRTHEVARAGRAIELTGKEWALLEFFLRHAGEVVDRAAITAYVWDDNHDPFTNVLEVLVRRLRAKIDDPFEPKLIHTLRGAGYRFGVPATPAAAGAGAQATPGDAGRS
jgi:two-component system copper resistance phosphate regulon response regulator CusR